MESNSGNKISCDYLIVGAGTACLSFVDTVLTRRKDVTFVIVDRFSAPGGHWTKAYPFVRLHQPSCWYGVNSLPLGKLDKKGNEPLDQNVRASGKEICEYYMKVVENFEATGRVRTYFQANYEGEAKNVMNMNIDINSDSYDDPTARITHTITDKDGKTIFVDCTKVVRCESNVQVPSMRDGPPFPTHDSVECISPNKLPDQVGSKSSHENYLVVGGGKTGVDTIIYLLKEKKISHDQITWVVPRPSWYFVSDKIMRKSRPGKHFWKDLVTNNVIPVLEANSAKEYFLNMEKLGVTQRVDLNDGHSPIVFKAATVSQSEMDELRRIQNVVKHKGRITSITSREVVFADGEYSIPFSPANTLVIDCTMNDFFGYLNVDEDFKFFNPHKIRLGPFTNLINPSHTSAQIGFLEAEYSDTASGDQVKNSYLFFPKGKSECTTDNFCRYFVLSFYGQLRTDFELEKCPTYQKFVLNARTSRMQPAHHDGILGLFWAIVGPIKLVRKAAAFRDKMENGGYEDFPTTPYPGRAGADASKHEANLRNPPDPKEAKPKSNMMTTMMRFFISMQRKQKRAHEKSVKPGRNSAHDTEKIDCF